MGVIQNGDLNSRMIVMISVVVVRLVVMGYAKWEFCVTSGRYICVEKWKERLTDQCRPDSLNRS